MLRPSHHHLGLDDPVNELNHIEKEDSTTLLEAVVDVLTIWRALLVSEIQKHFGWTGAALILPFDVKFHCPDHEHAQLVL